MIEAPDNTLWDVRQAAKFLGVSVKKVRSLIEKREIPFVKIGRLYRFRPASVQTWVKRQEQDDLPA